MVLKASRNTNRSTSTASMDPSLWRNLPTEIVRMVVENCDRETLIDWSYTSQYFYDLSSDLLWSNVQIGGQEIRKFHSKPWGYRPTEKPLRDFRRKDGVIVNFLIVGLRGLRNFREGGFYHFPQIRQEPAKRPLERVKNLRINFDGQEIEMPDSEDAEIVGQLLQRSTQLKQCYIEGQLSKDTLRYLVDAESLRSLEIRTGVECVEEGFLDFGDWAQSQILNLDSLVGLTQLSRLTIGRLATKEAQGLALAVATLASLSALSISANAPSSDTDDTRTVFSGLDEESPVIEFLASLLSIWIQQGDNHVPRLAQTLKTLELRDIYRSGPSQPHHTNVLASTLGHLQSITSLDLCLLYPAILQTCFSQIHLHSLQTLTIAACHHYFSEEHWFHIGVFLPTKEQHTSSSFSSIFESFLHRHQQTLSTLTFTRPTWSARFRRLTSIRFRSDDLQSMWKSEPRICINYENWEHGCWDFCHLNERMCVENTETKRLTLQGVESGEKWLVFEGAHHYTPLN